MSQNILGVPSWSASEWTQEFDIAKQQHDTHAVRAAVFQSTLHIINQGVYISENGIKVLLRDYLNQNDIKDNSFYISEIPAEFNWIKNKTKYEVVQQDCLELARTLKQKNNADDLAVLNMASASNPGGGVYGGAGAQEEYLFRCSDYYRFLFQYATHFDCRLYNIMPNQHFHYPLDRNFGGVFSRNITIFRDTEANGYALLDTPWNVNFIAVAACNLKYHERGQHIPEYLVETTLNKIRTILRIAYSHQQTRLVLGAFGCGAFGNPPQHMAELFAQCLHEPEFAGRFKEIYFAILPDHNDRKGNYQAFKSVFEE